jgi:hypothetical protein
VWWWQTNPVLVILVVFRFYDWIIEIEVIPRLLKQGQSVTTSPNCAALFNKCL